jgi:hypothetical protein
MSSKANESHVIETSIYLFFFFGTVNEYPVSR